MNWRPVSCRCTICRAQRIASLPRRFLSSYKRDVLFRFGKFRSIRFSILPGQPGQPVQTRITGREALIRRVVEPEKFSSASKCLKPNKGPAGGPLSFGATGRIDSERRRRPSPSEDASRASQLDGASRSNLGPHGWKPDSLSVSLSEQVGLAGL